MVSGATPAELLIGPDKPVFVIAELGINHDGDLETAKHLVASAIESGADAVKLQTYMTEKRVGPDSPIFANLKRCELSYDEQAQLFELGRSLGGIVFSTPFDSEAVAFLEKVGNPIYKVASFDCVNHALLRDVAKTGKPVIMSTGMASQDEIDQALRSLSPSDVMLMHCVSAYPTPPQESNLAAITRLLEVYKGRIIGYSDHTIGTDVPGLAVAAGAMMIEKHFTLDRSKPGGDHAMSADPETFKAMVNRIREVSAVLGKLALGLRPIEQDIVPFRRPSK